MDNNETEVSKDETEIENRTALQTPTQNQCQMCNHSTIKALKHLISGINGEVTLIAQLAFQYFLTNGNNNTLSNTINKTLKNKYSVLNEFSALVIDFGGVPKFTNGQGMYWGARSVDYQLSPDRFVQNNIRLLERQIREYNKAINYVNNEQITTFLTAQISNNKELIEELKNIQ